MKTVLNLVSVADSEIKYRVDVFPDGEHSLVIEDQLDHKVETVRIIVRISSMNELFVLMQACDILKRHGMSYEIFITYLMSMRMDRVMDWNRPYSLKLVTDMIRSLDAKNIYVFEPHSKKTLELLGAEEWKTNFTYHRMSFMNFNVGHKLVYPDAGAAKRYSGGFFYIAFNKVRDLETGKIVGLELANKDDKDEIAEAFNITVIDDLCDAGGTFLGVAEEIRKLNPNAHLQIVIAHMVNPKGIENLSRVYDDVYISNSYKDWDNLPDNVHVTKLW